MITPFIITLDKNDYLDKAFRILPANAFIHKGRCGIGGTTLEILAKRCSIIVVPTRGIIANKCNAHPELFGVDGDVSVQKIVEYLTSTIKHKKIMSTPESFAKIIDAAASNGMLNILFKDYFLLMDECHTAITEAFRKGILTPFKCVWKFKSKTFISATPFQFSNEKFRKLKHIHIRFHQTHLGKVVLRPTGNVEACIDYYINNPDAFTGKLFIFYNSVTEIAECIRRNNLTAEQAHIYCADKEDNYDKLPDNLLVFQREPTDGKYAQFNFFTCKYFEGIDIYEDNATVLLVTDVHKAHTKVGISNKGVQAVGRLRKPTQQIIHITNNRNLSTMKTMDEFRKEYEIHVKLIDSYNMYVAECKEAGIQPLEAYAKSIERFAEIDKVTHIATLNSELLDQVINELVCNEEFNSVGSIRDAWEHSLYQVDIKSFKSTEPKKRKSKADKLKEDVLLIDELENNKVNYATGYVAKELKRLQQDSPLAHEAYYSLSIRKLEELMYNEKTVKQALIEKHNKDAETQLLLHLSRNIEIGNRYTIDNLVRILQFAYNLFRIRNPKTGDVMKAEATDLNASGRYKLHKCKLERGGKVVNGYIIQHCYFSVPKAA